MKLKRILTMFLAGATFCAVAQTHLDGEEYYKADQLENAYDLLQRSLSNPNTDKAVSDYYLGMISLQGNKKADAEKYFSQGVAANPDYAFNYVGQGQLKLMGGDVKGAESLFKEAQKHTKKDAALEIAIARAYYDVNPVTYEKQINKQIEKAQKYQLENPEIYIFEGDRLKDQYFKATDDQLKNQLIGKAAAQYDMAKNYNKNSSVAYVKYANLFTNFNPDFAIKTLKELLMENPNSALGQRQLALAYEKKGDYKNAAIQYGNYVKNPSHFKSDENQYAFLLFYDNQYQKGYDFATQLLASNPTDFTAQRFQFMNAAQLDNMTDQLLPMAEALYANHQKDPKKNRFAAIDYNLISRQYQKAGRLDDAIAVLEEGTRELPNFEAFHKLLADIYVDKNDMEKASAELQNYLDKTAEPGYSDYVKQAIYTYYAGRQNIEADKAKANKYFDTAVKYANMASEKSPSSYQPVMILGDIEVARTASINPSAKSYYQKALQLLQASQNAASYASDEQKLKSYLGN